MEVLSGHRHFGKEPVYVGDSQLECLLGEVEFVTDLRRMEDKMGDKRLE